MAPDTGPITATSAALVRLLSAGPARVSLDDGALRFEDGRGAAAFSTPVGAIDRVETRRSWFWTRLAIREAAGVERAIGGLDRREAERVAEAIREDAARAAETLAPQLAGLDSRLSRFHATDRYIRKSLSSGLQADIADAVQQCGGALARAHLPPRAAEALSRIERVAGLDAFEAAREGAELPLRRCQSSRRGRRCVGRALRAADRRAGRGDRHGRGHDAGAGGRRARARRR